MASYRVVEHTIPGQHIREYPYATTISDHAEEAVIKLAVKQYIPTVSNDDDFNLSSGSLAQSQSSQGGIEQEKALPILPSKGPRELCPTRSPRAPTQVYPDLPADYIAGAPRPVTLTTSKHQEVWTFIRSNFLSRGPVVDDGRRSTEQQDRVINPNADPETEVPLWFYRPECTITFKNLPYVRPTTYYIFGAKSPFSPPQARKEKQDRTGTGVGGSGGVQAGKVQSHIFENGNHFLPFVDVEALAEVVNVYLEQGLRNTVKEDTLWKNFDSQKSERDRLVVSKRWLEAVGQPTDAKRSVASKL